MKGRYLVGLLATLGLTVLGCTSDERRSESEENDPVEEASSALGTAVTGCSTGVAGYNSTTKVLTLTLASGVPVVLSAPQSKIAANGIVCRENSAVATSASLTTTSVVKIVINGADGQNDKVIVDMLPGSFGKIFSTTGGVTLNLGTGTDAVMFRGSSSADKYSFAKAGSDYYAELSGDKTADVKVVTGGTLAVSFSMGAGADTFTASPAAADLTAFGSSSITAAVTDIAVTVYGGKDADTLRGGSGNDVLYGGDGDDKFIMAATADGADTYYGDADNDTVDYSNRTSALRVDIGPATPTATGTVDLSTVTGVALDTKQLSLKVDGGGAVNVTFAAADATPAGIVAAINATVGLAGVASMHPGPVPYLMLSGATSIEVVADADADGDSTNDADSLFGLAVAVTSTVADADDGLAGEHDDVRFSVENITGGSANDVLVGSSAKNVIKGGAGNDDISGGPNTTNTAVTQGDVLSGEAGDDTFHVHVMNKWATINGGDGTDGVSFAYRSAGVAVTLDGSSNDGVAASNENINVAADVEDVTGGDGADTITGSAQNNVLRGGVGADTLNGGDGDDTLIGGPGADVLNGGPGTLDVADYSAASTVVNVTLCVASAATGTSVSCGAANDGETNGAEGDQVLNCEWVKGGSQNDSLSCAGTSVDCILEGNDGNDTLVGGLGNDQIFGGNGIDSLSGGDGDDYLDGNAGVDTTMDGGLSDGDICITDAGETPTNCELP